MCWPLSISHPATAGSPITPLHLDIIIGANLKAAISEAVESGELAVGKEQAALQTLQDVLSDYSLSAKTDTSGESADETSAPDYPDSTACEAIIIAMKDLLWLPIMLRLLIMDTFILGYLILLGGGAHGSKGSSSKKGLMFGCMDPKVGMENISAITCTIRRQTRHSASIP